MIFYNIYNAFYHYGRLPIARSFVTTKVVSVGKRNSSTHTVALSRVNRQPLHADGTN